MKAHLHYLSVTSYNFVHLVHRSLTSQVKTAVRLSSFESFKKCVNLNERGDVPSMTSVFLWFREHRPQSICGLSVSACCPVAPEDLRIISSLCQLYSVFYLVSFSANSRLAVGKWSVFPRNFKHICKKTNLCLFIELTHLYSGQVTVAPEAEYSRHLSPMQHFPLPAGRSYGIPRPNGIKNMACLRLQSDKANWTTKSLT